MWLLHGHGNWLFDIIEQGLKLGCLGAFPRKVKVKDFGFGYFRTHAYSVRCGTVGAGLAVAVSS